MVEGERLDGALEEEIRATLRASNAFYVPSLIVQAPEVPRSANQKLSEVTVKKILRGDDPGNIGALANPSSIEFFTQRAREIVTRALG